MWIKTVTGNTQLRFQALFEHDALNCEPYNEQKNTVFYVNNKKNKNTNLKPQRPYGFLLLYCFLCFNIVSRNARKSSSRNQRENNRF